MAFEPATDIHQLGKARRMAFRKAVLTKAFNLLENIFGKGLLVATLDHAAHQPVMKALHAALALPGGHGTAQVVGLARREVRRQHGDLHDLLLKYWHAQRTAQRLAQFLVGIGFQLWIGAAF